MPQFFEEGSAKIIKEEDTFFNPAQKLNRDISALLIKSYLNSKENIRILTSMSATGLRGIRYLKEIPNAQMFFNDICPKAIQTIKKNLELNGFDDYTFIEDGGKNLKTLNKKINITLNDCIILMEQNHRFFNAIDVDPFGSSNVFVESAIKAAKHKGLIFFTCTDKAALCSNEDKCYTKYNSVIKKNYSKAETPIRVLLSYISHVASKHGASITPLLSLSVDFYVRVVVQVYKGKEKEVLKNNSYFMICNCMNLREIKYKSKFETVCNYCKSTMRQCGPFWNGPLHDKEIIKNMLENGKESDDERTVGILRLMLQEIPNPFYFEMSKLSSSLKVNSCKLKEIMTVLCNEGYQVSLTHCENNAFKSNAPFEIIADRLKQIINKEISESSLQINDIVEEIFKKQYFRGKVSSGMKPLSLPKKNNHEED